MTPKDKQMIEVLRLAIGEYDNRLDKALTYAIIAIEERAKFKKNDNR